MNADPDLSDILDTVLDFVPDGNALLQLDSNEGQHSSNCSQLSEMAAIKTIQDSLMLCEKAVPSPNVSLPARPPAYNANVSVMMVIFLSYINNMFGTVVVPKQFGLPASPELSSDEVSTINRWQS